MMATPATAAELRDRMDQGSLNLRGVAAMLRRLEEDYQGPKDEELGNALRLLARDVDLEADAMGEAEAFLLRASRAPTLAPPAGRRLRDVSGKAGGA